MPSSFKAAIYCRVSTEEQAREGFSIAAQKKTLTEYCAQKGWDVVRTYVDEGMSGKNTSRPAFQQLIYDSGKRIFNILLVWRINRLSRKNADLLNTVEYLGNFNIGLVSYSEQFDSGTPSGKLMLSMLGSIGEFERDTIVENIRAGMEERAKQGLFNGGRVLGYETQDGKLVVNETQASSVKRIFELYMAGSSLKQIQIILENECRLTKNECHFHISTIKRILKNPLYAGAVSYNKTKKVNGKVIKWSNPLIVKGEHEPIIAEDDFQVVQQIIDSKASAHRKSNSYLLSGILRCPECRGKMTGHSLGDKYRYYVCLSYKNHGSSVCSSNCVNAGVAENIVIDYLCDSIKDMGIVDNVYKTVCGMGKLRPSELSYQIGSLKKDISSKKNIISRYFKVFEEGASHIKELKDRIDEVSKEVKTLEDRLLISEKYALREESIITYDKVSRIISGFKEIFLHLDKDAQKKLMNAAIKEAYISPSKSIMDIVPRFPFSVL